MNFVRKTYPSRELNSIEISYFLSIKMKNYIYNILENLHNIIMNIIIVEVHN